MKEKSKLYVKNKIETLKLENKKLLLKYNKILKKIKNLNKEILIKKNFSKENLKKNIIKLNKELENGYKYSLRNIFIELFDVVDSIEKAIELKTNVKDLCILNFLRKLEHVLKNFIKIFKEFKIYAIKDVNVKFDPNVHQAISIFYNKKFKNNYIINIVQKGYILYKKLLRPAMVIVNKKS
ncbi:nucleotide exchange factor GrpE [Buchnera aphidicola]|uniref:nucleotide exchange factor GrpE n=1 Tax=Buchnera aphidicola TaxID=9 RepID=UPI0031B7ED25